MSFKLSKFDIGMIVAFVVVTGAGVGGYFYTNGLVDAAKTDLGAATGELQKLVKQRYLPSDANIKTLDNNIKELRSALQPIEEKVLKSPQSKLGQIAAKNPVTWKNSDLDQTVQRLQALAKSKRVTIPDDGYFGFSRYKSGNPSEAATLVLGKQLYAIELLATQLFNSNAGGSIIALKAVRRTFDEEGNAGGGGTEGGDAVRGSIITVPSKLYRVYPFEVEFIGNTVGLRNFVNSLNQAPVLFIIRSVQVTNSKLEAPKIADLGKGAPTDARAGSAKLGRDFVFGSEQLQVKMRVDMIEWLGTPAPEPAKPAQGAKK